MYIYTYKQRAGTYEGASQSECRAYIYMYTHTDTHTHTHMYIYTYKERAGTYEYIHTKREQVPMKEHLRENAEGGTDVLLEHVGIIHRLLARSVDVQPPYPPVHR
jgi:hypothetical protein